MWKVGDIHCDTQNKRAYVLVNIDNSICTWQLIEGFYDIIFETK